MKKKRKKKEGGASPLSRPRFAVVSQYHRGHCGYIPGKNVLMDANWFSTPRWGEKRLISQTCFFSRLYGNGKGVSHRIERVARRWTTDGLERTSCEGFDSRGFPINLENTKTKSNILRVFWSRDFRVNLENTVKSNIFEGTKVEYLASVSKVEVLE